jgi:hypothetical protein
LSRAGCELHEKALITQHGASAQVAARQCGDAYRAFDRRTFASAADRSRDPRSTTKNCFRVVVAWRAACRGTSAFRTKRGAGPAGDERTRVRVLTRARQPLPWPFAQVRACDGPLLPA